MEQETIMKYLQDILLGIKDTFQLPTHKTIVSTLKYAIILFACSILSTVLKFYTFIFWQGALFCVAILLGLILMERSEYEEIDKAYSTAMRYIQKAKKFTINK